jgi:flagellar biosynthesis/type III secretory pathway protein FliH
VEEEEEAFLEPPPPPLAPPGKVLGHRPPTAPPESKLPPITESIQIPTGDPPPKPKAPPQEAPAEQAPPPPPPEPIDQQILEEARRKAQQMVTEAQAEARHLIEEIRLHANMAQKEATERGIEEGREEGRRQGREEFARMMEHARDLYQQTIREREKLLTSAETELARLAIKVAEKIIGQEIRSSGEVIMGVVRQALTGIKDREEVLIRVSPDDYHIVNEDRTALARMVEGLKSFELVVDSKVEAGGCVIETNLGNVDARLVTQLAAIDLAFERVTQGREEVEEDDDSH